MSYINLEANAYDLSMKYAKKALGHAQKHNNVNWKCLAYNHIGTIFYYKGNKDSASYYFTKILRHLKRITSKVERVAYMTNIGYIFMNMENIRKLNRCLDRLSICLMCLLPVSTWQRSAMLEGKQKNVTPS